MVERDDKNRFSVSGGVAATEPLRRGLNELTDVCQHVLNTFQVRRNYFPTVTQHITLQLQHVRCCCCSDVKESRFRLHDFLNH